LWLKASCRFPYYLDDGPTQKENVVNHMSGLEYIQERKAQIFKEKIGVVPAHTAKEEIALLEFMNI